MHEYFTSASYMCLLFDILAQQNEAMPNAAIFRFVMTIKCKYTDSRVENSEFCKFGESRWTGGVVRKSIKPFEESQNITVLLH